MKAVKHPTHDIHYMGHHKCATNWMRRFLKHISTSIRYNYIVTNGDNSSNEIDPRHIYTIHLNVNYDWKNEHLPNDCLGFHLLRDPRDVLISDYFSTRNSHNPYTSQKQLEMHKYLNSHDEESGLLYMVENSPYYVQIEDWKLQQYQSRGLLDVKYEDLIKNPSRGYHSILSHLNIDIQDDTLSKITEWCSFKSISGGREPGQEDKFHHFRKGISGDWKIYFNHYPKVAEYFYKEHSSILFNLEYS